MFLKTPSRSSSSHIIHTENFFFPPTIYAVCVYVCIFIKECSEKIFHHHFHSFHPFLHSFHFSPNINQRVSIKMHKGNIRYWRFAHSMYFVCDYTFIWSFCAAKRCFHTCWCLIVPPSLVIASCMHPHFNGKVFRFSTFFFTLCELFALKMCFEYLYQLPVWSFLNLSTVLSVSLKMISC